MVWVNVIVASVKKIPSPGKVTVLSPCEDESPEITPWLFWLFWSLLEWISLFEIAPNPGLTMIFPELSM